MSRRRKLAVLSLAGLLLLAAGAIHWLLQPERLAPALLKLAGDALGLEITASGLGEYRLRGTPQLIVRGLVAREPGQAVPVLTAERVFIAVPWSTLRARGADLTATRLELDAPVFDLGAFQRWQSRRPPGQMRIPTLTRGLRLSNARLRGDGWALEQVDLRIPRLAEGDPLRGLVSGRYRGDDLVTSLDLAFALLRLGRAGGLGIAGDIQPAGKAWRVPARVRLSGYLHTSQRRLERLVFAAGGRYLADGGAQRFALGVAGPLEFRDGLRWERTALALRGADALPSLDAEGALVFGDELRFDWRGRLAGWPAQWPALPPPLGQSRAPLPFALDYRGTPDLADIGRLQLQRDGARFDARFRLFEVMAWLDALDARGTGTPLPPLSGRLIAPRLEVSGATLEGVDIRLDDPAIPSPETAP